MTADIRIGKNHEYRLGPKIGSGSFGDVYYGVNVNTSEEVAIKLEPRSRPKGQLERESKFFKRVGGGPGLPTVRWYGVEGDFNVMVMDLLGPNLEDLFKYCGRAFSLKTLLMIIDQLFTTLEYVHSKGILHRDLKPSNMAVGFGKNSHQVYVIDFGLGKPYVDKHRKHIHYREGKPFIGTARYASTYTHLGIEQSRRDDLESLAYCILYFYFGKLPWQGLPAKNKKQKYQRIGGKKLKTSTKELCRGAPAQFEQFLNYIRCMQFTDTPDYSYLRRLFRSLFCQQGYSLDFLFDWIIKEQQHKKHQKQRELVDHHDQMDEQPPNAIAALAKTKDFNLSTATMASKMSSSNAPSQSGALLTSESAPRLSHRRSLASSAIPPTSGGGGGGIVPAYLRSNHNRSSTGQLAARYHQRTRAEVMRSPERTRAEVTRSPEPRIEKPISRIAIVERDRYRERKQRERRKKRAKQRMAVASSTNHYPHHQKLTDMNHARREEKKREERKNISSPHQKLTDLTSSSSDDMPPHRPYHRRRPMVTASPSTADLNAPNPAPGEEIMSGNHVNPPSHPLFDMLLIEEGDRTTTSQEVAYTQSTSGNTEEEALRYGAHTTWQAAHKKEKKQKRERRRRSKKRAHRNKRSGLPSSPLAANSERACSPPISSSTDNQRALGSSAPSPKCTRERALSTDQPPRKPFESTSKSATTRRNVNRIKQSTSVGTKLSQPSCQDVLKSNTTTSKGRRRSRSRIQHGNKKHGKSTSAGAPSQTNNATNNDQTPLALATPRRRNTASPRASAKKKSTKSKSKPVPSLPPLSAKKIALPENQPSVGSDISSAPVLEPDVAAKAAQSMIDNNSIELDLDELIMSSDRPPQKALFKDLQTAELMYNQLHSSVVKLTHQVLSLQRENKQLKSQAKQTQLLESENMILKETVKKWQQRWAAVRSFTESSGLDVPPLRKEPTPVISRHSGRARKYNLSDSIMSKISFFEQSTK